MVATGETPAPPEARLDRSGGEILRLTLSGAWTLDQPLPDPDPVRQALAGARPLSGVHVADDGISRWDSGLLTYLLKIITAAHARDVPADLSGLPEGVQRLLQLAQAVPERKDAQKETGDSDLFTRAGALALGAWHEVAAFTEFLGETVQAMGNLLKGQARYRTQDLWLIIQEAGAKALGIVSLISLMVGLILAFIGAVQLRQFGAEIYVADLVAIGTARQMGALMTAIIVAGRTGAAFAAQLGTMQTNEEIDALRTLGLNPMEFLVVPRMIALVLMMPLLTIYADLMGILGGALVSISSFGISSVEYYQQTRSAVGLVDFGVGMVYSLVFAVLIAIAGCLRGMQSGRDASAVGRATTSAVVTSIVLIVVADAVLTVIFDVLGI